MWCMFPSFILCWCGSLLESSLFAFTFIIHRGRAASDAIAQWLDVLGSFQTKTWHWVGRRSVGKPVVERQRVQPQQGASRSTVPVNSAQVSSVYVEHPSFHCTTYYTTVLVLSQHHTIDIYFGAVTAPWNDMVVLSQHPILYHGLCSIDPSMQWCEQDMQRNIPTLTKIAADHTVFRVWSHRKLWTKRSTKIEVHDGDVVSGLEVLSKMLGQTNHLKRQPQLEQCPNCVEMLTNNTEMGWSIVKLDICVCEVTQINDLTNKIVSSGQFALYLKDWQKKSL